MDVVSLLPSATEIVYALGAEPAAVSHQCDYPPAARSKPAVTRSRVEGTTSAEINESVARARDEGSVYDLRLDRLRDVDPDLILTQGACEVCAVDDALVTSAVDRLGLDTRVLSTHPHSLADVFDDVERIGAAIGREDRARALVADYRERVEAVETAARSLESPRVAVLDWLDPVMVAGHWVPELVTLAGGTYGLADPGDRSYPREWPELLEYDPAVLVAAPCGFGLDQALGALSDLTTRDGWGALRAVRDGRVYVMDGNGHVNRPGPRLVDTLESLAGLVHPDRFATPPSGVARRAPGASP